MFFSIFRSEFFQTRLHAKRLFTLSHGMDVLNFFRSLNVVHMVFDGLQRDGPMSRAAPSDSIGDLLELCIVNGSQPGVIPSRHIDWRKHQGYTEVYVDRPVHHRATPSSLA